MQLSSWTIGKKMTLAVGALTLTLALTCWLGLWTIGSLGGAYDRDANLTNRKIEFVAVINKAASDMAAGQRGLVMGTYAKNLEFAGASRQLFEDNSAKLKQALDDLQPLLTTEAGQQQVARLRSELARWLPAFSEIGAAS